MDCEKCERLMIELKINSDTISRVAQDNKSLRAYVEKLENELEKVKDDKDLYQKLFIKQQLEEK